MASENLTFLQTHGNRNIYRFDLPLPTGSEVFTEYRGRTFIVRGDGSHLETPPVETFETEEAALKWLHDA